MADYRMPREVAVRPGGGDGSTVVLWLRDPTTGNFYAGVYNIASQPDGSAVLTLME